MAWGARTMNRIITGNVMELLVDFSGLSTSFQTSWQWRIESSMQEGNLSVPAWVRCLVRAPFPLPSPTAPHVSRTISSAILHFLNGLTRSPVLKRYLHIGLIGWCKSKLIQVPTLKYCEVRFPFENVQFLFIGYSFESSKHLLKQD